jgi:hypothetical protein
MSAIDSFGRDDMLGATDATDRYSNCTVSNYLSDRKTPSSVPNGVKMTAVSAVLVGAGALVGGLASPRIGRPVGAAAGAGFAGLATYLGYKAWQLDVGPKVCKDWLGPLP